MEVQPRYGESLEQWCLRQEDVSANRKAHRAKCLLVMWTIWKHRNDVVFNGATPSFQQAMQRIHEEGQLSARAGLFKEDNIGVEVAQFVWDVSE